MNLIVIQSTKDVGPTLSPDWRMWSVYVEARTAIDAAGPSEDGRNERAFRRTLEDADLHVPGEVTWEPVCAHDLSELEGDDLYQHTLDCNHYWLGAHVHIPARDGRHAYEQVCGALGITPSRWRSAS